MYYYKIIENDEATAYEVRSRPARDARYIEITLEEYNEGIAAIVPEPETDAGTTVEEQLEDAVAALEILGYTEEAE